MLHDLMLQMISYFGKDTKRINHAIKVFTFAQTIGSLENLNQYEMDCLLSSAILHDIGIKISEVKYHSSSGKYQELEGPPVARDILQKYEIKDMLIDRICYLIGNHHTYAKIDGIDFQILVESDFLVNIDEDNMNVDTIKKIESRYFKTNTGLYILKSMY